MQQRQIGLFFNVCALGFQHVLLDIPQALRQIHIVVVGIAEAANLVPHSLQLLGAMIANFLQSGEIIYQLAVLKNAN